MDNERPNLAYCPMPDGYVIFAVSTAGTPTYQKRLRRNYSSIHDEIFVEYWTVVVQLVWDGWSAYLSVFGDRVETLEGYPTATAAAVAAELQLNDLLTRHSQSL